MQALFWFRAIRTRVSGTFPAAVHFCHVQFGYQFSWFAFHDGAIRGPSGR